MILHSATPEQSGRNDGADAEYSLRYCMVVRSGRCSIISRITIITLPAILALTLTLRIEAQELQGAASALQQMVAQKPAPPKAPPRAQTPAELLRHDLEAFRDKAASSLPPQEAARGWLALVDRYTAIARAVNAGNQRGETKPLSFQDVLAALPPPSAWNALTTQIQVRQPAAAKRTIRDINLLLLSHVLQNDQAGQWKDLDALQALLAKTGEDERPDLAQNIMNLSEALAKQSGDLKRILQGIELRLAVQQVGPAEENIQLPDLVTLFGPQKAESLLRRVLVTSSAMVEIPVGDATRRLAQKLAFELAARVKVPQWKLAESLDATELYAALAQRFVKNAKADPTGNIARAAARRQVDHETARVYYLLGLIVKGRTQQAAQIAASFGTEQETSYVLREALTALDRASHTRALSDFLHAQLTQNPNLPLWDIYIQSAPRVGQTVPMLALVRATAARKDLSNARHASPQHHLYHALLSADQVEEAVTIMRRILAAPEKADGRELYDHAQIALRLVRLGYYLKQDAWIKEGMTFVNTALQPGDDTLIQNILGEYAHLLMEMGRYSEAEQTLIAALVHAFQGQRPGQRGNIFRDDVEGAVQGQNELIGLAQLYHRAGRPRREPATEASSPLSARRQ